jgi:hypothetical protein
MIKKIDVLKLNVLLIDVLGRPASIHIRICNNDTDKEKQISDQIKTCHNFKSRMTAIISD